MKTLKQLFNIKNVKIGIISSVILVLSAITIFLYQNCGSGFDSSFKLEKQVMFAKQGNQTLASINKEQNDGYSSNSAKINFSGSFIRMGSNHCFENAGCSGIGPTAGSRWSLNIAEMLDPKYANKLKIEITVSIDSKDMLLASMPFRQICNSIRKVNGGSYGACNAPTGSSLAIDWNNISIPDSIKMYVENASNLKVYICLAIDETKPCADPVNGPQESASRTAYNRSFQAIKDTTSTTTKFQITGQKILFNYNLEWDSQKATVNTNCSPNSSSSSDGETTSSKQNGECNTDDNISPLVLQLDNNPIVTVGFDAGVFFDLDANGTLENVGWIKSQSSARSGFLVLDLNHNGLIDNGRELFGNFTQLANGQNAKNGFNALAQYDNNALDQNNKFIPDGIIDERDTILVDANGTISVDVGDTIPNGKQRIKLFDKLNIWTNEGKLGVTNSGELHKLNDFKITKIIVNTNCNKTDMPCIKDVADLDQFGNWTYQRSVFYIDSTPHMISDIWFNTKAK